MRDRVKLRGREAARTLGRVRAGVRAEGIDAFPAYGTLLGAVLEKYSRGI